jgi:hypothetical protein
LQIHYLQNTGYFEARKEEGGGKHWVSIFVVVHLVRKEGYIIYVNPGNEYMDNSSQFDFINKNINEIQQTLDYEQIKYKTVYLNRISSQTSGNHCGVYAMLYSVLFASTEYADIPDLIKALSSYAIPMNVIQQFKYLIRDNCSNCI